MDDLLDLTWSGSSNSNNKHTPPNIPHKPSYLTGNPTTPKKNNDAFADLLNLPSSQKAPNHSNLPLAEQQRLMRQGGSYSSSSSLSGRSSSPAQKPVSSFDSMLDPFSGKRSASLSTANMPMDALRGGPRGIGSSVAQEQQNAQWNFDFLESATASSSPGVLDPFDAASLPVRQSAPPAFEDDEDDNPLGILSKPAQKPRSPSPPPPSAQQHSPSPPPRRHASPSRSPQPASGQGDMIVAQLVDMGFSVEQAQVALEATGANDLQKAIDLLVQNTEVIEIQDKPRRRQQESPSRPTDTAYARQVLFSDYVDEGQSEHPPSKPQRPRHPQRDDGHNSHPQREMTEGGTASSVAFQQQKEKLVAQATELGGFLYKNASMFVKAGRQRVTKAVEDWQEQQRADQLHRESGRPRWMREDMADEEEPTAAQEQQYAERFVDDNSSDEDPELEKQRELAWKQQQEAKRREYAAQARRQQHNRRQLVEEEDVYVSPSRRRTATPSSRRSTPVSTPPPSKANVSTPPKPAKKPRTRPVVNASPDVVARANAARQRGNEKFKLGQFGEAEAAYSQAISILPPGHDHLVILSNNRAAARLKIGEYKKCIEDCTVAIEMAQAGGDENCESEGVTIQWREQIVKALHRKGDALENIEKYKDATKTYEEILRIEGQSQKVNQALARCRRAVSEPTSQSSPSSSNNTGSAFPGVDYSIFEAKPAAVPSPAKKPSSKPAVRSPEANVEKSKAVAAMRAQAAKQEAEDAERLQKTDEVNARIQQWKAGKENNLRALLATLDTLLWPGAQWRGAQMSELIEPKRCKIVYLKAIAKVHPDKLPPDVTVEQRMLASSIFSTLNEAWDSFKSQI